jgi:glutamate synthase domain-containing protein 2
MITNTSSNPVHSPGLLRRCMRAIDTHFPTRYLTWLACAIGGLICAFAWVAMRGGFVGWVALLLLALALLGIRDVRQTKRSVLRNYPVAGHLRYLLESIRPEIRQYFIEGDQEAAPFSRQQRSIVYQRAKGELDKRPFGTQLDVLAAGFEWINHSMAPSVIASSDFRVTIGGSERSERGGCTQPYSASVFNISAMSFGSLSANAILALNLGAKRGGFAHDTGEGSISGYHREHGGDLIWEIGSGYFGCRNDDGTFSIDRFEHNARSAQVKMIELKLSQGAKPGHGGVLPAAKVSAEIAAARGVPQGADCLSPARHSAFDTPEEMLRFIQLLRERSGGKPVGFKFCVGHPWEWFAICKAMLSTGITPDFIVVDGKEGGTGAAPLEFTDHVGAPLQEGLLLVHNTLVGIGLRDRIKIGCAGKVVSAFDIVRAMALGADWCNAARGFMFALGCIQSQSCHTDRCPTGVATQDVRRQGALVVPDKAGRVHAFHHNTMQALRELLQAAGVHHPREITAHHIVRRLDDHHVKLMAHLLHYTAPGSVLAAERGEGAWPHRVYEYYWPMARSDSFSVAAAAEKTPS